MNFETYTMIVLAVIALALHLYMKYQDKKDGATGAESKVSADTATPATNSETPYVDTDYTTPNLIQTVGYFSLFRR